MATSASSDESTSKSSIAAGAARRAEARDVGSLGCDVRDAAAEPVERVVVSSPSRCDPRRALFARGASLDSPVVRRVPDAEADDDDSILPLRTSDLRSMADDRVLDPPAMMAPDEPLTSDRVAVLDLDEWLPSRRRRRGAIAAVAMSGRGTSGGDSDGAVRSITLRRPRRVSMISWSEEVSPLCGTRWLIVATEEDVLMNKESFGITLLVFEVVDR